MSTQTEINDFCPVMKGGEEGAAVIDKVNTLSANFGTKFDQLGHPSMEPAEETAREGCDPCPYEQKPQRVPSIIYTLLGE